MHYHSKTRNYPVLLILLATLSTACSTSSELTGNTPLSASEKPRYSITYIIHGDANYLYHDEQGVGHQADEKVLKEAKQLAQQAKDGEVFIFHQRPERKILWIFPKKDREFLHYQNGKLVNRVAYSPASNSEVFSSESQLYHQLTPQLNADTPNILLYFGHEIPYKNGNGYFSSIPELAVNTKTFSEGIKKMLPDSSDSFDLTVLSTCNNGSPDMVNALQPHSRYLLASPQNLHLSHIDTKPLLVLEDNPEIDSRVLAEKLAQSTYLRLQEFIQTVISLSVYDMAEINTYLEEFSSSYNSYLENHSTTKPGTDNVDCSDIPVFSSDINLSHGLSSWYRPPRFGQKAKKKAHSGWGCKE